MIEKCTPVSWRPLAASVLVTCLGLAGCSGPHDEVISRVKDLAEADQYIAAHKILEAEILKDPKSSELLELRLELLLQGGQPALAAKAYTILKNETGQESDLPAEYLKTGTVPQRIGAVRTMALLGDERWVKTLSEKYGQKDAEMDRVVVSALGDLRHDAATDLLISALQNESWAVRADSAQALGKLRDPKAVIPLFEAMKDEDRSVVLACGNALLSISKQDEAPVELYAKYTASPETEVRKIALIGLALQQDRRGTEGLIQLAKEGTARDRFQALRALGRSGDPAAAPLIREALNDKELGIRVQAIEALGQLKDTKSVPQLKKIVTSKEEPYEVKKVAAVALLQIVEDDKVADPDGQQVKK